MVDKIRPDLPKLRDWPMFRAPTGKRRKRVVTDGRAPPHMSELIMALVPGGASEKLMWLREQRGSGKLDGDDPEEIAQAEALLTTLMRLQGYDAALIGSALMSDDNPKQALASIIGR